MKITLNGVEYDFDDASTIPLESSPYDLKIIEPGFDKETAKFQAGGVDANLRLPSNVELRVSRTGLLPVAKVYVDTSGNKKLDAYFD